MLEWHARSRALCALLAALPFTDAMHLRVCIARKGGALRAAPGLAWEEARAHMTEGWESRPSSVHRIYSTLVAPRRRRMIVHMIAE